MRRRSARLRVEVGGEEIDEGGETNATFFHVSNGRGAAVFDLFEGDRFVVKEDLDRVGDLEFLAATFQIGDLKGLDAGSLDGSDDAFFGGRTAPERIGDDKGDSGNGAESGLENSTFVRHK